MTELNVTHMVESADDYPPMSASVAELGNDAAAITWRNAKAYAASRPLLTNDADRDDARQWLKGFGAWEPAEIAAWSDNELNALIVQFVAGDIRELEAFDSFEDYQKAAEAGTAGGRLYKADDGQFYFYMGD